MVAQGILRKPRFNLYGPSRRASVKKRLKMRSLILITLAGGAAAQTTPLTCPTAEIPPASVRINQLLRRVSARWRCGSLAVDSLVDFVHRPYGSQESCPYNMEPCCPAGQADCPVDSCGETHVSYAWAYRRAVATPYGAAVFGAHGRAVAGAEFGADGHAYRRADAAADAAAEL